jgi:hypothetical protein
MTVETVFEQYRRLHRELSQAREPEPDLQELLAREEKRLGLKFIPVGGESNG